MKNSYIVATEGVKILINRRNGEMLQTFVDEDDLPRLNKQIEGFLCSTYSPNTKSFYAMAYVGHGPQRKRYQLARLIMNTPPQLEPNHKNWNTLDNRKQNLENVTKEQNMRSRRKKFLGYWIRKRTDCARFELTDAVTEKHLGSFKLREDAVSFGENYVAYRGYRNKRT